MLGNMFYFGRRQHFSLIICAEAWYYGKQTKSRVKCRGKYRDLRSGTEINAIMNE